jgi:hypothetical protein
MIVESRAQIAAIVGNRIGKPAARMFAEPSALKPDGSVDWVDAGGETLLPVASLPEDQGQAVLDNFVVLKDRIEALAVQMESEGDAGLLAARIIRLAIVTPEGFEALYAVGQQPVLVNWGYAAPGQGLPGAPTPEDGADASPWSSANGASDDPAFVSPWTTVDDSKNAAVPAGPAGPPTPTETEMESEAEPASIAEPKPDVDTEFATAAHSSNSRDGAQFRSTADAYVAEKSGRRKMGPIAWLLPLLLLIALGWVIWLILQPLDPVIVEQELPPDAATDPVPDAKARRDSLLAQLDEATRLRDGLEGICIAPPKPKPDPAISDPLPDVPPEPEVVLKDPEPQPDPKPQIVVPRPERIELPDEVPQAADMPVDLAQRPVELRPEPTLCEPGWSPTQRPEVMVVIDGSGSMRESFPGASSRIDAAKGAIEGVIGKLHKDIRAGLVSFTDCGATSTPKKYRFSERPELLSRVRGVSPSRGTSLANSIRRAGNAAKSGGPATVVVVSDGEDTCGGDPCAAARKLKAQKPLLKVNVIDLSGGRSAVLQCVASVTGGRVFTPQDASQMNEEMQEATGQPDASQCNG